jgi:hypothetical protein
VQFAVVSTAQRNGEFAAYFAPERALLREPEMMRIRRAATAGEAGLGAYELKMILVPQPKQLSVTSK